MEEAADATIVVVLVARAVETAVDPVARRAMLEDVAEPTLTAMFAR